MKAKLNLEFLLPFEPKSLESPVEITATVEVLEKEKDSWEKSIQWHCAHLADYLIRDIREAT